MRANWKSMTSDSSLILFLQLLMLLFQAEVKKNKNVTAQKPSTPDKEWRNVGKIPSESKTRRER